MSLVLRYRNVYPILFPDRPDQRFMYGDSYRRRKYVPKDPRSLGVETYCPTWTGYDAHVFFEPAKP